MSDALSPEILTTLDRLRRYLDEVGFARLHKYVMAPQRYFSGLLPEGGLDALVQQSGQLALAATLMANRPCERAALTGAAAEAASHLVAAKLLREDAGQLTLVDLQLVSVQGIALFVELAQARAGAPLFPVPGPGVHAPLLAHHVDVDRISRSEPALDVSTGPGMLALFLARQAPRVVATEVSPPLLALAALNLALNQRQAVVELRAESPAETVARGAGPFAVVTSAAWVAPMKDGLDGPLYSDAAGASDGLGPVRQVIAGLGRLLLPTGIAYLATELMGDDDRPFFLAELGRLVTEHDLCAEVYLEDRIDHRINHGPLRGLANLVALREGWDRHQVFARVRHHVVGTLAATCRYVAVLVLRKRGASAPRVRVLSRYKRVESAIV